MGVDLGTNIRKTSLGQGIGNVVANGLIAWLLLRDRDELALWSFDGVALDVAITCLLLPLIVSWIVIATQKSGLKKGKLTQIEPDLANGRHRLLLRSPPVTGWAAVCFGLFGVLVIAPGTLLGFQVLGVQSISPLSYTIFKALWTGLMADLIVIPCVYIALLRRE